MNIETAQEIVRLWTAVRKIDAIKVFRGETALELAQAKTYLDDHSRNGSRDLLKDLCDDFVQSPRDLLVIARNDLTRLEEHIARLEAEIDAEIDDANLEGEEDREAISKLVVSSFRRFEETHEEAKNRITKAVDRAATRLSSASTPHDMLENSYSKGEKS